MGPDEDTVRYAGVGLRAVAVIVDAVVLFALIWVVGLATGHTTADGVSIEGALALVPFAFWTLYYVGLEATLGATRVGLSLLVVVASLVSLHAPAGGVWPALNGWLRPVVLGAAAARVALVLVERGWRLGPYADSGAAPARPREDGRDAGHPRTGAPAI